MQSNLDRVWQDDGTREAVVSHYLDEFRPVRRHGRSLQRRLKRVIWSGVVQSAWVIKRMVDVGVALTALIVLSPLMLLTWLAIRLEDGGPALFVQTRVGLQGQLFQMYKFRSMGVNADKLKAELAAQNESGAGVLFKMKRDPRITRVGRIIHKLSIDEFPQLINVLIGNMAMVGPRPALPQEVAAYSQDERMRLSIKPGLTCFWQIGGRSDIDFKGQVRLDVQYIQSQSVWLDLWIILKTVPAIVFGKGAY